MLYDGQRVVRCGVPYGITFLACCQSKLLRLSMWAVVTNHTKEHIHTRLSLVGIKVCVRVCVDQVDRVMRFKTNRESWGIIPNGQSRTEYYS